MSERDFWERIEAATDRAEDMAKAERVNARMRKAGVSEKLIAELGADASGKCPHYTDEDGPELITGAGGWYVKPRDRR